MKPSRILLALLLPFSTVVYATSEIVPALPSPDGADEIKKVESPDGRAHQISFTMHAAYPTLPALDHYKRSIGDPWVACSQDNANDWFRYIDGTRTPNVTVHERTQYWSDATNRRLLLFVSTYYSSDKCADVPETDVQHVSVVQYEGVDPKDVSVITGLHCPALSVGTQETNSRVGK